MIKKILFGVVVVLVVATAGVVSQDQYQKYQNKHTPVPVVTVKDMDREVEAVKTAAGGEYKSLQATALAECQKGSNAYAALTPALKAKTPAPNCALLQN